MADQPRFNRPDLSGQPSLARGVPRIVGQRREGPFLDVQASPQPEQPREALSNRPVQVTARVLQVVASITGSLPGDVEQFVSQVLASSADESSQRQLRVRADHHGLIIDPDFAGLVHREPIGPRTYSERGLSVWREQALTVPARSN
jgi:hypothetical protein